jgi:hypothetical protein
VVERKTVRDMSASIVDGRLEEQKMRYRHEWEVRRVRTTYVMEGDPEELLAAQERSVWDGTRAPPGPGAVQTALWESWVLPGFGAFRTPSPAGTVSFLTAMSGAVEEAFRESLRCAAGGAGCPSAQCSDDRCCLWGREGVVPLTLPEWHAKAKRGAARPALFVWGAALTQMNGISADKAHTLLDAGYKTPRLLAEAVASTGPTRFAKDLEGVHVMNQTRAFGPVAAQRLVEFVTAGSYKAGLMGESGAGAWEGSSSRGRGTGRGRGRGRGGASASAPPSGGGRGGEEW